MSFLRTPNHSSTGPAVAWLAAGFLLAGLGTVLLGPILPALALTWHLTDAQSGLLLAAKFFGAFLGGITVLPRLRLSILAGTLLCAAGFGAFAVAPSFIPGLVALFVSGLGLGQIIAATNILAGRRYTAHTGSALSSLNAFFSLGAVATGLLAAALFPHFALSGPILSFASLFLVVGLGGFFNTSHNTTPTSDPTASILSIPLPTLIYFSSLLFLYGGLETCLAGWITTYTQRFSDAQLLGGQSALVLLWIALTLGRALASAALRFTTELTVQRAALALSAVFLAALAFTHHAPTLSVVCVLLGLSLAAFFPATFALLIQRGPSARQAGLILAVSGLGAALFPWLMGIISTHTGSLRTAMVVPLLLALALLALSLAQPRTPQPASV